MYEIGPERQLELLKRLLFAWDAQWFLKSVATFGPDEALKVNARTRTAFGRLEMKAMLALLGKEQAVNLADALEIIKTYHALAFNHNPILSGISQLSDESSGGRGKALLGLARCAALDNAKRAALPTNPAETNCVYCQMLWTTWLENLLPDAQIEAVYAEGSTMVGPHGVLTVNCFRSPTTLPMSPNSVEAAQAAHEYPPTSYFTRPDAIANTPQAAPSVYEVYPPTMPTIPAAPGETASSNSPLIGSSEVGSNRPAAQQGSLRQRLEQSHNVTSLAPNPQSKPPAIEPPLVPNVQLDPFTGRPLFTNDMEKVIEAGVRGSKKKNFNLISRVMLSKEAQEMLKKSAEQPAPLAQPMTLATSLDAVLQRLLITENTAHSGAINQTVRFNNTPYGDLQIQVGSQFYQSIDEVPPGRIKELLQQAIATWQQAE